MRVPRRTNLLWGIVLLALALVLVLRVLEVIPPGIYDLVARSWPALLVLAGLAIFLRPRVTFGSGIALLLTLALVGGVGVVAFSTRASEQRSDHQETVEQVIGENITLLSLRATTRASTIEIVPATSANRIIRGDFMGSIESRIQAVYLEEGAAATFTLFEAQANPFPLLENIGRGTLRLALPAGLPLDIELTVSEGNITLNTSTLNIERMNIDLQQGDALVTLPVYQPLGSQPGDSLGTLAVRNGDITLFIPPEVGARLELNREGSGIEPIYDPNIYNFLVGDVLEARNIDDAQIQVRYIVTAPRGRIRVAVPGE